MQPSDEIRSIPGVSHVEIVSGPGMAADAVPGLLIEVPHGATKVRHYLALRRRLSGEYPDDLRDFFFVNTDVGAPECASESARMIADPGTWPELEQLFALPCRVADLPPRRVVILRSLVPRTFIDCNRMLESGPAGRASPMTPAVPEYVSKADTDILLGLYRSYRTVAERAYEWVCGSGGLALMLHTYAPRSIRVDRVDGGIVEVLRRAYEPEVYESWPARPEVDIVSQATDGTRLAPPDLVTALALAYAKIGVQAEENATYRLDPSTMGHLHSTRYPGQVTCLEISRACLADPFSPFEEMRIGGDKVRRMAGPIAATFLSRPASPGA